MAQNAAKQTIRRNSTYLRNLHLISLFLNGFFIVYRIYWHYRSFSKRAAILYTLNTPALIAEWYLDRIGRPKDGKLGSEDLNAPGLMEAMWDVVYVTWGCLVLVAVFGEGWWWLWSVIPVYGAYAAYSTMTGMKSALGGMGGAAQDGAAPSKRQAKLEKREGRVKYR